MEDFSLPVGTFVANRRPSPSVLLSPCPGLYDCVPQRCHPQRHLMFFGNDQQRVIHVWHVMSSSHAERRTSGRDLPAAGHAGACAGQCRGHGHAARLPPGAAPGRPGCPGGSTFLPCLMRARQSHRKGCIHVVLCCCRTRCFFASSCMYFTLSFMCTSPSLGRTGSCCTMKIRQRPAAGRGRVRHRGQRGRACAGSQSWAAMEGIAEHLYLIGVNLCCCPAWWTSLAACCRQESQEHDAPALMQSFAAREALWA